MHDACALWLERRHANKKHYIQDRSELESTIRYIGGMVGYAPWKKNYAAAELSGSGEVEPSLYL